MILRKKNHVPVSLVEFVQTYNTIAEHAQERLWDLRSSLPIESEAIEDKLLQAAISQLSVGQWDWFLGEIAKAQPSPQCTSVACKLGRYQAASSGPLAQKRCFARGQTLHRLLRNAVSPEAASEFVLMEGMIHAPRIKGLRDRDGNVGMFLRDVNKSRERLLAGIRALRAFSTSMVAVIECDVDRKGRDFILPHAHVLFLQRRETQRALREKMCSILPRLLGLENLLKRSHLPEERIPLLIAAGTDMSLINKRTYFRSISALQISDRAMYFNGLRRIAGLDTLPGGGSSRLRPESRFRLKIMELPDRARMEPDGIADAKTKPTDEQLGWLLAARVLADLFNRIEHRSRFTSGAWNRNAPKAPGVTVPSFGRLLRQACKRSPEEMREHVNNWAKSRPLPRGRGG